MALLSLTVNCRLPSEEGGNEKGDSYSAGYGVVQF